MLAPCSMALSKSDIRNSFLLHKDSILFDYSNKLLDLNERRRNKLMLAQKKASWIRNTVFYAVLIFFDIHLQFIPRLILSQTW